MGLINKPNLQRLGIPLVYLQAGEPLGKQAGIRWGPVPEVAKLAQGEDPMLSCPTCSSIDKAVTVSSILNQSTSAQYSTTYGAIIDPADAKFTPVVGVTKSEVSQQFLNLQGRVRRWINEPLTGSNPGASAMRVLSTVLAYVFFFAGSLGIFTVVAAWNTSLTGAFDVNIFSLSCALGYGPVAALIWLRGRFQMKVAASVSQEDYEKSEARSAGWYCYRCDAPYSYEVSSVKKGKTSKDSGAVGAAVLEVKNQSKVLALSVATLALLGSLPGAASLIPTPTPTAPTSTLTSSTFEYILPASSNGLMANWKSLLKTCGFKTKAVSKGDYYLTNYNLDSGDTFPGAWLFNFYTDSVSLSIDVLTPQSKVDCLSESILGISVYNLPLTSDAEIFPQGYSFEHDASYYTFQWDKPVE